MTALLSTASFPPKKNDFCPGTEVIVSRRIGGAFMADFIASLKKV
jgi:hypothetical protein